MLASAIKEQRRPKKIRNKRPEKKRVSERNTTTEMRKEESWFLLTGNSSNLAGGGVKGRPSSLSLHLEPSSESGGKKGGSLDSAKKVSTSMIQAVLRA